MTHNAKPAGKSGAKEWRSGTGEVKNSWDAPDRYAELLNFKLEVINLIETTAYDIK